MPINTSDPCRYFAMKLILYFRNYFNTTSVKTLKLYRATLCVSAVFAVVRPSHSHIVSRRPKISSDFFLGPVTPSF